MPFPGVLAPFEDPRQAMLDFFRDRYAAHNKSAVAWALVGLGQAQWKSALSSMGEDGISVLGDAIANWFPTPVIQAILDAGVDPNLPSARGRWGRGNLYPIHAALKRPDILSMLVRSGVNLEVPDDKGRTPMRAALVDFPIFSDPPDDHPARVLLEGGARPAKEDLALVRDLKLQVLFRRASKTNRASGHSRKPARQLR